MIDDTVHCCDQDEDLDYGRGYNGPVTCAGCGTEMEYSGDGTDNRREDWSPIPVKSDPHPGPDASAVDLYDWHLARSLADGISIDDAAILAEGYVERYLR